MLVVRHLEQEREDLSHAVWVLHKLREKYLWGEKEMPTKSNNNMEKQATQILVCVLRTTLSDDNNREIALGQSKECI